MEKIAVIALSFVAWTCHAEWSDIPMGTVVTNSDMIVIAVLTNVTQEASNSIIRCRGILKVKEVLKGPAEMNNLKLEWSFSVPPKSVTTDHTQSQGRPLLWLLKRCGQHTFEANYYKRVQGIEMKDDIKNIIERFLNKMPESAIHQLVDPQH